MNIEAAATYQINYNGNGIKHAYAEMNYDGKTLDAVGTDGEKITFMQLTNDDINNILSLPASNIPLEERLTSDYPMFKKTTSKLTSKSPQKTPHSSKTRRSSKTPHSSKTRRSSKTSRRNSKTSRRNSKTSRSNSKTSRSNSKTRRKK